MKPITAYMIKTILFTALFFQSALLFSQKAPDKIEFINFSKVNITDDFWKPKIDKVATVTIPVCIDQTEDRKSVV